MSCLVLYARVGPPSLRSHRTPNRCAAPLRSTPPLHSGSPTRAAADASSPPRRKEPPPRAHVEARAAPDGRQPRPPTPRGCAAPPWPRDLCAGEEEGGDGPPPRGGRSSRAPLSAPALAPPAAPPVEPRPSSARRAAGRGLEAGLRRAAELEAPAPWILAPELAVPPRAAHVGREGRVASAAAGA